LRRIERLEYLLNLVRAAAQRVKDGHESAETRARDCLDLKTFLLQTANDADMRITPGTASAKGKSDIHNRLILILCVQTYNQK
jgi:hypothetical protein